MADDDADHLRAALRQDAPIVPDTLAAVHSSIVTFPAFGMAEARRASPWNSWITRAHRLIARRQDADPCGAARLLRARHHRPRRSAAEPRHERRAVASIPPESAVG